jgi:hypothetical protein
MNILIDPSIDSTPHTFHRQDLPAWDRVVDIVCHTYRLGSTDKPRSVDNFGTTIAKFLADHDRVVQPGEKKQGYYKLPDSIRFRICQYFLVDLLDGRPVCLTRSRFTYDVWKPDSFVTLKATLDSLKPYLRISFGVYADLLVTLFVLKRFHVIYSPFITNTFDPAATLWFDRYAQYMQSITIELDMTTLGFGPEPSAIMLNPGTLNVFAHLQRFVDGQKKRSRESNLGSLVLLCRRFYGNRPNPSETEESNSKGT